MYNIISKLTAGLCNLHQNVALLQIFEHFVLQGFLLCNIMLSFFFVCFFF